MSEDFPELPLEREERPKTANEELLAFMRTERWIMLALLFGAAGAAIYFFTQMMKHQATPPVNGLNGFGYPGLPPANGAFYPIQIINQLPPPYLQGAQRQLPPQTSAVVSQKVDGSYCDKCDHASCQCY